MKPKQIVVLCVFLLLSGFCSLVYQNVWLREFRLIFGGTNAASATVFAIFMGGLGSGGLFFGRRSETSPNPLRLYGWLELGAAGLALASLPLLKISELLYLKSGGVFSLGFTGGTVLRLALATLSIGACAFFMGGNVPVAVKFFQADRDRSRRGLAILYGVNVIGAVLGTLVATFWCLENFGSKGTLIVAAIINVAIGLLAINFSKTQEAPVSSQKSFEPTGQTVSSSIQAVVLCYSFLAGFLFFVMELVWIRMLLPLMGGSVYVPGSMLAVVLAGIGVGGFAYATRRSSRVPTVGELAVTLGFFAIALVLPLALGDRVAFLAFHLNQLRAFGFTGQVSAWLLVASLLVLLPSLIAGYQFPLFTGLLGRGNRGVGQHLGLIYLSNTLGSITGSLAGGLLLLPGLGAVGLWRAATIGALILCVIALAISLRRKSDRRWLAAAVSCAAVVTTAACLTATGPTAVWRHTPIGYGDRVKSIPSNPGELKNWMHSIRFGLLQDFDGREANIGIYNDFGLGFFTNGKGDGSVRGDAAINIMTGVLGALLHPEPKSACVIGLGTGVTAGWLADVPGMERVDVIEIEPSLVEFVKLSAPANRNVLEKENVHLFIGDGREALQSRKETFDLIGSVPSNPYRAGVASLYTQDFYQIVEKRLAPGGIFMQWVQAYEINTETLLMLYRTLRSVFPMVQTWQTGEGDLIFVCTDKPLLISLPAISEKMQDPVFREALDVAWMVDSTEGFLAHFLATSRFADAMSEERGRVNTDDRNLLEFYFARNLYFHGNLNPAQVRKASQKMGTHFAPLSEADRAAVDLDRLTLQAFYISGLKTEQGALPSSLDESLGARMRAARGWAKGDMLEVRIQWKGEPTGVWETLMMAEAWADAGDERAELQIKRLSETRPVEARVFEARLAARRGELTRSVDLLVEGFEQCGKDPWPHDDVIRRALEMAGEISSAADSEDVSQRLFDALKEPFVIWLADRQRLTALFKISKNLGKDAQIFVIEKYGENIPWNREFLELRLEAYEATGHPDAQQARRDLQELIVELDRPLVEYIRNN